MNPILSANRPFGFLSSDICALVMSFVLNVNGPDTINLAGSGRNFWKSAFAVLPAPSSRLAFCSRSAAALSPHSPYTDAGRMGARST